MNKLCSLLELENEGLNVHNYTILNKPEQVTNIDISKSYTARFDRESGEIRSLPFKIFDVGEYGLRDIYLLLQTALDMGCYIILSDGRNYDRIMVYNIVYRINTRGDFLIEWSDLKVPLRHMYRHGLYWASGSLLTPIHWWERGSNLGKPVDLRFVKRFMTQEYTEGLYDRFVECTTYKAKVGKLDKDIVYWQV